MKKAHLLILLILLSIIISVVVVAVKIPNNIFTQIRIDTWGHFISFFFLTLILNKAFKVELINTGICLFVYAALSELGQYYLGFRNGELLDFIANITGIVVFMSLKWGWIVYGKSTISKY